MINNVVLIGRLTKDLDLKYSQSGTAVASFTLAVNRNFKNQDGNYEADFINCVIWRKSAELMANMARKGSQVGITGRIQTRSYEGKDGKRVYVTEVVADNFNMLDSKPQNGGGGDFNRDNGNYANGNKNGSHGQTDPFGNTGATFDISDDDIPF